MREKDLGIWQSWTWGEVAVRVADLAGGLAALGFRRGDKLALIGDNRPELYWAMAAVQALDDIGEEGALQLAMRRGWRAIHYQNYSLLYQIGSASCRERVCMYV